jgi:hypothetical protein
MSCKTSSAGESLSKVPAGPVSFGELGVPQIVSAMRADLGR